MQIRFIIVSLTITLGFTSVATAQKIDLSDVGTVFLDNTGSVQAQQAFLHGLAQIHNFEFDFAAADFQEAQQIDPDFALAYWGEAMTHNHAIWMEQDKDSALIALNKYASSPAARQDRAPTELERDLFAAVDILYGEGTKQEQDDLYLNKMAELYAKYPDNVEVAAFYALSLMGSAHEGREFGLYMRAAALMQNFLSIYPQHPGVAHYLIHATDDPTHAPLGAAAAKAYSGIAPNAGHAQHMTTHIFLALGDWDSVILANVRAMGITNTNRADRGLSPSGCGHYNNWLLYGYLQQGKRDQAHEIMSLCYRNVSENGTNTGSFATQRALYLLDTAEWQGDVAMMQVDHAGQPLAMLIDKVTDGLVSLNNEDIAEARADLMSARESLEQLRQEWDADGIPVDRSTRELPLVSLKQLEARIALATGATESGLELLREAVSLELDLPFGFGPPRPAKPSLELLGETLLAMGQYAEAREVLKTSLTRTPNKAMSIRALDATERALSGVH